MGVKKRNTAIVLLLMIILSIFFVLSGLKARMVFAADDMPYHINRIQELVYSLKHGNWYPYLYTRQFKGVPYPLGIFYPQLTLIPIAALCIVFNSYIIGIYAGFTLYTFLTMVIMYIIERKLNKSSAVAFVVSVVYTFSTYRLLDAYGRFAIGEFLAMTFIPMAIYGLYAVIRNGNDWEYLGLGLSFTLLSHVLSTFLCIIFLVIELLGLYSMCSSWRKTIIGLSKAVVLFVLSSLIFVVPFIEQETYQHFLQPTPVDLVTTNSYLFDLLENSLNNNIIAPSGRTREGTIGVILLLVMAWGMVNFRKLNKLNKRILIGGVLSFVLITSLFPWSIMMHTPLRVIQFPFRILAFTTFLLSLIAGEMFESFYISTSSKRFSKIWLVSFSLILIIVPWYSSYKAYQRVMTPGFTEKNSFARGASSTYWFLDQYTPAKAMDKFQQLYDVKAQVNGKLVQLTKVTGKVNETVYSDKLLNDKKLVVLPASMYKNIQIWQNHHRLKVNKKGLVTLHKTGKGSIEYKYVPSNADKLSRYISVFTWVVMFILGMVKMVLRFRKINLAHR